jgi:hypothetical protein
LNSTRLKSRSISLLPLLGAAAVFLLTPSTGFGYPVPDLPADNLVDNPWFRSTSDPSMAGLDGWTLELNPEISWGISQKESNPSPEVILSGVCGFKEVYCGTGARWANEYDNGDPVSYPGIDVYISQVVQADPNSRMLRFFMYFVNHRLDIGEATISGGQSSNGPWDEVWLPASISQDQNPGPSNAPGRNGNPWFNTPMLETTLGTGYPFYKITLHARYPESNTSQGDVGIKVTGVYFTVLETDAPEALATPWVVVNPTLSPDGETVSLEAGSDPRDNGSTATPVPPTEPVEGTQSAENGDPTEAEPTPEATTAEPSPAPTETEPPVSTQRTRITPTPAEAPQDGGSNGLLLGFLAGMMGAGVLFGLFQLIRSHYRVR